MNEPKTQQMIGTYILAFFIVFSLTISSLITFGVRHLFFGSNLGIHEYELLAVIAAILACIIFLIFAPIDVISGKKNKDR